LPSATAPMPKSRINSLVMTAGEARK
jgi:hypothetical protein